jgi:hypothetical protein
MNAKVYTGTEHIQSFAFNYKITGSLIDFILITINFSLLITTKNGAQNEFIFAVALIYSYANFWEQLS